MFDRKKLFSYRPGIRMTISIVCVFGILGGSVFSIYYALKSLYDSALKDTSTILFLDLETRSHNIADTLDVVISQVRKREPIAEFIVQDALNVKWVQGEFSSAKTFIDLGIDFFALDKNNDDIANSFSSYNGQVFYVERIPDSQKDRIRLFEISTSEFSKALSLNTKHTIIYILNRSGKLIFTNSADITPEQVTRRPLVNSFIKMPFRQGQSEIATDLDSLYGFFQEIPRSNMVIFVEKTKTRAMQAVYGTIRKVAAASIFYLIVAIVLLQIPLWQTTKPIRTLTDMATKMSQGDFEVEVRDQGFGELAILSKSFGEMAENLKKRDKTIAALHVEKLEKTKIEQGIRVARTIQERFLFKPTKMEKQRLAVAARYEPSLFLAGDWYGVHNDQGRNETIIAIVDITGHGIESSMMTPVMSVLFQEQKSRVNKEEFDIKEFLARCNSALYEYGAGISTATGIIARFSEIDNKLSWINAGHPAPIIVTPEGGLVKTTSISTQGTLLGFAPNIALEEQSVMLTKGAIVTFFSDGLLTAPVGGSIGFSRKDLLNTLKKSKRKDVDSTMNEVMSTWKAKNADLRIEDDMCLVVGLVL